ncbi:MAG: GyrI-like domain-containing protein [Nitrospirota bacterium]
MRKILVIAGISGLLFGCAPRFSEYEHLKEPAIRTMPGQKMITVEAKGAPNVTGGKAFGLLYKTIYQLKVKGIGKTAPRARWPKGLDTPKDEWVSIYGLPVPEGVESLPTQKSSSGLKVKITYWEYGEVAEILHIGPYDKECATIERLHNFIKDNGYKIAGPHEEEYLKGPGMFGKGNPAKYQTIIRYQIEKEDK